MKTPFARSSARPGAFHFLTPVWGKAYTKTYLELVMPAQLSAGNLGAFAGATSSKYIIYTTEADAEAIRAAPAFAKLTELIPAVIEIIDHEIVVPHDSMSICFRKGIEGALAVDAAAVFLTPDLVFADGSFAALRRLYENGYDVVFNPGLRTIKQGVTRTLLSKYEADGVITVAPRELMRVALDNIHPLSHSSWWEEGEGDLIPANLFWRVGSEGILSHCFHLHPLLVRAQRRNPVFFGTVDDDYVVAACPDASRDYVIDDSDELLMIEVSDATRFFVTGFRKGSVEDVSDWAEQFTTGRHRELFPIPVRMHAGIEDRAAWRGAERRARNVVKAIQRRMARPIWQLAFPPSGALARRMWRFSADQALAEANGQPVAGTSIEIAGARIGRSASRHLVMRGVAAVRGLRSLSERIWQSLLGRIDKPTIWSMRYLVRGALVRDLKEATATAQDGIVVCGDPTRSVAYTVMTGKARIAVVVTDGDTQSLLYQESSAEIPDSACDVLVLEGILPNPRQTQAWLGEFARVIRPNGKLIIVADRFFDVRQPSRPESCAPIGAVETIILPEFRIIASRQQGGLGSTLMIFTEVWFKLLVLRSRLLRLLIILSNLLLIPPYLAAGLIANGLAFLLNFIDGSGQLYTSSMIVAERNELDGPEPWSKAPGSEHSRTTIANEDHNP